MSTFGGFFRLLLFALLRDALIGVCVSEDKFSAEHPGSTEAITEQPVAFKKSRRLIGLPQ